LNLESESKAIVEQRRYSLRKREPVPKEDLELPVSKKPDQSAFELKKTKKVKITQNLAMKAEQIESKAAPASEHDTDPSINENSTKGNQEIEVKTEEIFEKQASPLFSAPKSLEMPNLAAISNEIQRRNMLLQAMMPLIPDYIQQRNPANLVNINLCRLLNPQIQPQASKTLMFATNSQQTMPMRLPLYFRPNSSPSFLFKSYPMDFNARCNL